MVDAAISRNASLLRRLGAMIYDGLLILAILMLVTLVIVIVRGSESEAGDPLIQALTVLFSYAFLVGYWSRFGRTLGMQAWRLRIEDTDGHRPGIGPCSLRYVGAILSWLPAGAGFLWQLVDREGLSWHDRLSKTRLRHYPKAGG